MVLGVEELGGVGARFADLDALGEAVDGGAAVPGVVLVGCMGGVGGLGETDGAGVAGEPGGVVGVGHGVARGVLGLVQRWLGDERFAGSRLVLVTEGAVAVGGEDVPGLVCSAVWGLVRSAQSEQPGRLVLVDVDGLEASFRVLAAAVAGDEPQLVVRGGEVFAARLVRVAVEGAGGSGVGLVDGAGGEVGGAGVGGSLAGVGTVLVTGGTGGLGALVARHLVGVRGVRSLC